jgi:hypothetical protein
MALAAQAVLNRRPLWPALLIALALAGCAGAPPEREPLPPPPPTAPAQGASLPPAQPLLRPPPAVAIIRPGPPPSAPPLSEPMAQPAPAPRPSATSSLVALADRQAAVGDYVSAAAQLERALRIRPQDPVLWQKLAWLRLQNGDFDQAATLAARSDSLAGGNAAVHEQNRRIVDLAHARQRP